VKLSNFRNKSYFVNSEIELFGKLCCCISSVCLSACLLVCVPVCLCLCVGQRLESSEEDLATVVNIAAAADTRTNWHCYHDNMSSQIITWQCLTALWSCLQLLRYLLIGTREVSQPRTWIMSSVLCVALHPACETSTKQHRCNHYGTSGTCLIQLMRSWGSSMFGSIALLHMAVIFSLGTKENLLSYSSF